MVTTAASVKNLSQCKTVKQCSRYYDYAQ